MHAPVPPPVGVGTRSSPRRPGRLLRVRFRSVPFSASVLWPSRSQVCDRGPSTVFNGRAVSLCGVRLSGTQPFHLDTTSRTRVSHGHLKGRQDLQNSRSARVFICISVTFERRGKSCTLEFQGQNFYSNSVMIDQLNHWVLCGFSPTRRKRFLSSHPHSMNWTIKFCWQWPLLWMGSYPEGNFLTELGSRRCFRGWVPKR